VGHDGRVQLVGAASSAIRDGLSQAATPAKVLGHSRHALYLRTAAPPGVIAVLTHDAVRLPCSLVLPTTSAEVPLSAIAPRSGHCLVGEAQVRWAGPDGPVTVAAAREWAPCQVGSALVDDLALERVRCALALLPDDDVDSGLVARLTSVSPGADIVAALLGRGSGLTPAGDDVLAGFLIGVRAFGQPVQAIVAEVSRLAPTRTTALSAALLGHAVRGQCIDELAALATALSGRGRPEPVLARLIAVGHTSGAALAAGLVAAAKRSRRCRVAA
jgi:Protein of unknown function (DUF2877)